MSGKAEVMDVSMIDSVTFFDFVGTDFIGRTGYAGDFHSFVYEHGTVPGVII